MIKKMEEVQIGEPELEKPLDVTFDTGEDFTLPIREGSVPVDRLEEVRNELKNGVQETEVAEELGGEVSAQSEAVSAPIDYHRPGIGERLKRRFKKAAMLLGVFGVTAGVFGDKANAEDGDISQGQVNTNTASAGFSGEQKNWGPGTNKVDWAKAPGGKIGSVEISKQVRPTSSEKTNIQQNQQQVRPGARTFGGTTYSGGNVIYEGGGSGGFGGYNQPYGVVRDAGNGWVHVEGGILVRSDRNVYPQNYNPNRQDIGIAKKNGYMWSSEAHTYIKNPFNKGGHENHRR